GGGDQRRQADGVSRQPRADRPRRQGLRGGQADVHSARGAAADPAGGLGAGRGQEGERQRAPGRRRRRGAGAVRATADRGPSPVRCVEGAPTLAAEVRSENDRGDAAEADMAAKRADYFAAGTSVVWDVDPVAETIDCYRAAAPTQPVRFRRGEIADAEPAVPG